MFRRVIIAVDLSKASYALVNCLSGLRAYGTKECLLLLCLSIQESSSVTLSYSNRVVEAMLTDLKEIVEKQGFEVETRWVVGNAKYEINKIADDEDFSIIVVGGEQEQMMKAHLFGGLAYDVISFTKKPVLLVRLSDHYKQGEICTKTVGCEFGDHILFPTDFSEKLMVRLIF